MATTCPQCGQSLDQDFGVVSCPNCHSVLVFDLDGNVEIQDANVMSQEIHDASESEEPVLDQNQIGNIDSFQEISASDQSYSVVQNEETSFELSNDLDQPIGEVEQDVVIPEEPFVGEPTVPLVNTSGSAISYHLKIEGIDTKDMRSQVEEALGDSKFPWTAKEIIRQTKDGILEIGPVNPVVASVLVRRLKDISVNISWRQNIYEN